MINVWCNMMVDYQSRQCACLLACLMSVSLASVSLAAQVDAHARDPYQITVVLDFADHAALTPLLADTVERQTSDQLRRLFGDLAQVRVVRRHPLIDRLAHSDLSELSLSHADFRSAELFHDADDTIFLFRLDYGDGFYRVSWRQILRDVEQIGPRGTSTTPDRAWLGKAVCLAVRDDFAPTALLTPTTDLHQVELVFRGSQSRGWRLLGRWLTPGSVLQPFWVVLEGDGTLARVPVPYTVLRVENQTSSYWANIETNLPRPWRRGPRIVGFQAVRLPTRTGRLNLRLVDQASGAPVQAATVYANDRGFEAIDDADLLGSPDPRGQVAAPRTFNHVAYIRIRQGAGSAIDFPLPITADECDLVCRLPVDRAATKKGDFERELGYLVADVRALQALLAEKIRQINLTNADKRYEAALRIGQALLSSLDKQLAGLKRNVGIIHQEAKELGQDKNPRLSWLAQQLGEIERQHAGLQTLTANLARTIEKNDAQGRANVLIELGNQSLREGNIDDTLDKYTLALGEQPDQPQLAQRTAQLKKQWEVQSPDHGAGRRFFYKLWPAVDLPSLEARLPEAEQAFDRLEKAQDHLAALKVLKVNEKHLGALDQLVEQLAGKSGEQDQAEHEKYVGVLERLAKLQQRVASFCDADMPQALAVASEPAANNKPPIAEPPASPQNAVQPEKPTRSAPKAAPAKTPPKSKPKPAGPLDEEEPPLSQAGGSRA
ncbi:MAG TPA: hypothetical protein VNH11_18655 [Pirellulales bacterium]|nr:hypothetical protein [Pirellulales bacterium]